MPERPELLVDFITSLDGYEAAGWPGWWGLQGPEYLAWLGAQPEADHTVLLGATTYRLMAGLAAEGEPGTDGSRGCPRSSSPARCGRPWRGRTRARRAGRGGVRAGAEGHAGRRLHAHAGEPHPVRALLEAGLVDHFRVGVFPVITGSSGRDRIYDGYPDVALDLVASRTFDGRIQLLEYVPTVLAVLSGTTTADA